VAIFPAGPNKSVTGSTGHTQGLKMDDTLETAHFGTPVSPSRY